MYGKKKLAEFHHSSKMEAMKVNWPTIKNILICDDHYLIQLGIALSTVRFHRANIMSKSGMRNADKQTAWYLGRKGKRD